ncbi:CorA Metal Ion Transporter (MIT) Family [Thraustotheca clavata]|uniref:CorA Metal Ion Transporter (MIT) Family n=1 Tax=Thraustotheca clavata TaxID=74557 RepID=A0A1V9Y8E9_9STRA|nr:CorA Metal Ion Transporter (MIT) Family [Thraustotheca clavata]
MLSLILMQIHLLLLMVRKNCFHRITSYNVCYTKLYEGLVALGIHCPEKVDFNKLIKKIDTDRDGTISLDEFIHVVQMIKLAHLFKPESLDEGLRLNASFHVADYSPTSIHSVEHVKNIQNFMFSSKPSWAKVRWVHLAGISDTNDLHLRRLAIKYQFHPLALEDCMKKSDKIRCKYERYEDHTFIVVPVLKPMDDETSTYIDFCIKRHQTTLFEKDLAFVDGWKKSGEKPDIDNLRAMLEKLEQLMRKPQQLCIFMDKHDNVISVQEENDTDGNAGFRIWNKIYDNNMSKSYSKIRNHGTNFLVVSLLNAIVDDMIPLVQIFEVIINTLESLQVAQGRDFDTKRIFLAKKQLVVIEKIVRPMLDLVEGQLLEQEEFSKGEDKNYLRDVKDHLKQMVNDVKEHQASLTVIFNEDQQARAKAQADVQFTISVVAAIFLPATFMTGLYGMNFDNMPELHTEDDKYLCIVTIQFTAVGGAPIMKRSKFTVNGSDALGVVYSFLRKQLRLREEDALFVYCNNAFAPTPDQKLSELYECFHVNGILVLNYSRTQAWG